MRKLTMRHVCKFVVMSSVVLCSVTFVSCSKTDHSEIEGNLLTPSVSAIEGTEENLAKISASEEVKRSLLSVGNNHRMKQVIEKMQNNKETKIAYIGGSITEGYKVNTVQNYVAKTTKAWKERFQNDKIKAINAGLSGTSSTIGLMRAKADVLEEKPDLVVIEFAVNDANDNTSKMAYESLVKEILMSKSKPAVLLLFTVLENGYTCEDHMVEVGTEYQLPMISVRSAITPELKAGSFTWEKDYALDDAHPNNQGHSRIANYLDYYLEHVLATVEVEEEVDYSNLSVFGPIYADMNFYTNENFYPAELGGFTASNAGVTHFPSAFVWTKENTACMKFTMEGKDLFLLYKEANNDNMASLEVYIDGDFKQNVHGSSKDGWNNAEVALVLNDLKAGPHEVELRIKDEDVNKNFAILGLGSTGEIFSVEPVTAEQIPYTERAILNIGNTYRINQLMDRARAGEEITLGFIGGSITMGSGASSSDKSYAKLVFDWWVENFPEAKFNFVNAGIGATTSQFACARVEDDLLSKKPDFVVVEFSVNDEGTNKYGETYESLLRTILTSKTAPAVLVLNMVQYNNGQNAQNRHNTIATAYDLPIISMKESIYNEILFGNLTALDVSADNIHPNDRGHAYAAEIVTNYLGLVKDKAYEISTSYQVPETSNKLSSMTSKRYDNRNSKSEMKGFTTDTTVQNNITEVFRNGYKAKDTGASIIFKVTGSNISLQYRKTNTLGAPYAIAIIDGDEANAIELDGNYPNGWGDWLYLHDIATKLENKEHTVEIRITQDGQKDFYLVSVITTE